MKRVFYIECSGSIWREIAGHCAEQTQWQPVLWTASNGDAAAVKQQFPQAIYMTGTDAALGLPECESGWSLPILDAPLLEMLSTDESIALHMMDRMDPACGTGFSHDQRRRHYHKLLRYWLAAFDNLKPDLIVFSIAPHIVFDYLILAIARLRGIPTLMFERIGLPGWVVPMSDFRSGSTRLRSHLSMSPDATTESMPVPFKDWLAASLKGSATLPANYKKKLERYKLGNSSDMPSLYGAFIHEFKRALVLWRRNGLHPAPNSYLRSQYFPHRRCGPLETLVSRLRGILKKRQLMQYHDRLAVVPDKNENYIFLALHYQPERATVPMGGAFGDQTLIVNMLAANLPVGWKLYVKEHPWQLQSFGRGEVQRSHGFYNDISLHQNVFLLSRDVSTASMVRGARAVATVTGSVGWDAICSGIPVLAFGAAWYRDCPGVHFISSQSDMLRAMESIAFPEKPQPWKVEAFCSALAKVCVPGTLEPEIENIEALPMQNAAASMSGALIAEQHYFENSY